jgi:hypothetical protein
MVLAGGQLGMGRRLFTVCCAVSLLLCLGVGAAVARSYWVLDQWNRFRHTEFWSVELEHGHLFLAHGRGDIDQGEYDAYRPRAAGRRTLPPPPWSLFTAGTAQMQQFVGARTGPLTLTHYRLSLWWVAALAAILPAAWTARRLPWGRWFGKHPPGLCRSCGYDLRATPHRCPECGTPVGTTA